MEGRSRKPMTSGVGITYVGENCQTCNDSTKYIFAHWDGENGTHGNVFECNNLDCELKQNRLWAAEREEEQRLTVIIANAKNGISMERVRMTRKELGITLVKMARGLGVSPSTYSCYETCREVLPVEMIKGIERLIRKREMEKVAFEYAFRLDKDER